jgi:hypothetical protein
MLGPTTCAVEKRGSSTVNVPGSRIAWRTRSRRVTSHAHSAGNQDTGSCSRSRASMGWGSASSSSSVAAPPIGNATIAHEDCQRGHNSGLERLACVGYRHRVISIRGRR